MLNLDAVEMNIYLGKSLKNNIQKLQMLSKKFQSIFTGLQRKTNMINQSANSAIQPFWSEPYPTASKDVGGEAFYLQEEEISSFPQSQFPLQTVKILSPQKYLYIHQIIKSGCMQRKYRIFNQQGVFNIFWKNWEKLTNQVSKGILNSSSFRTISNRTPQLNFKKLRWNCYNGQENSRNVEERCYEISSTQHKQSVFNFSIYSLKKGLRAPSCDKSKEIEQAH